MPTTQETSNKAAIRRFCDAANSGDAELISKTIDELVEPDALIRTPLAIEATGAPLLKEVWARLLRAYPDPSHHRRGSDRGGGARSSSETRSPEPSGGEYMGIPPTGRSVTYDEIFIARFAGGRMAEVGGVVDVLSQMRQLGVIPA